MPVITRRILSNPILALIIANFIWGAASPIFKWSLQNIEPFTLAFLRFAIALIILSPFVLGSLKIEKRDYAKLILCGLGITVNIGFFFVGLNLTKSINAPIISSSAPVFLTIAGIFFLHENPKRKKILGGFIGLLGVMIIVLIPALSRGIDASFVGNLFLLVATLGSVWQTVLIRQLAKKYNALTLVFWTFVITSFSFLPLMLYETVLHGFLSNLSTQGIVGIVFGAVFSSAIAYYFYYLALENLPLLDVGIFTYLDPVVAIVLAVPLLGEIPTTEYIIGSLLVFVGIFIAEKRIQYHPFNSPFLAKL